MVCVTFFTSVLIGNTLSSTTFVSVYCNNTVSFKNSLVDYGAPRLYLIIKFCTEILAFICFLFILRGVGSDVFLAS